MLAESITSQLVAEIEKLYLALRKTHHSPIEIARTINSILLNEGATRQEMGEAWDQWYLKKGGKSL